MNGTNDTQVPYKQNLQGIKETLEMAGNKEVTVMELPSLNHLFRTSVTGMPQEYAGIEATFSPEALAGMSTWLEMQMR